WDLLKGIAEHKSVSINRLITDIDTGRSGNLSSAIRLYVLEDLLEKMPPVQ
ncbi:MAG: hypothetical protein COB93_11265, partial [Sneathiella sp.]